MEARLRAHHATYGGRGAAERCGGGLTAAARQTARHQHGARAIGRRACDHGRRGGAVRTSLLSRLSHGSAPSLPSCARTASAGLRRRCVSPRAACASRRQARCYRRRPTRRRCAAGHVRAPAPSAPRPSRRSHARLAARRGPTDTRAQKATAARTQEVPRGSPACVPTNPRWRADRGAAAVLRGRCRQRPGRHGGRAEGAWADAAARAALVLTRRWLRRRSTGSTSSCARCAHVRVRHAPPLSPAGRAGDAEAAAPGARPRQARSQAAANGAKCVWPAQDDGER